jgi:hypothetical protein
MENEEEVVDLFKDEEPEAQAVESAAAPEATTFEVPEKFVGKSIEDVIESYANLEKEMGRKANELGEMRKLTDHILQQPTAQPAPPAEPIDNNVDFDEIVENPTEAVRKVLSGDPRLAALEAQLNQQKSTEAHARLAEAHPDVDTVVSDPKFQNWVQQDPSRLANFQRAHVNLDTGTAIDMLTLYKQTNKVATDEAVVERDSIAAKELKDAVVETGSVKTNTKKVYRRGDLINLKMFDPARYSAMEKDIVQAYAEGRVKN